jgi:hypothetical protein
MIFFLRVDHVDATRDDGHICFASNASLAKRAHVSIQTVERHIAKLVSLGLLTRRSSGNGKRWARRDRQGSVVLATGLSLLPLAERYPEFLRMAQDYQDLKNELGRLRDMCSAAMSNLKAHLMPANRDEGLLSKASCCSLTEARARSRCALAMGISVGHVQPQLLICYESKGQSGPPFETKLPTITHSQRPILKPKIDTCPVNLTSKQASPFSSQIHRTSWLSLPAKVVVAEQSRAAVQRWSWMLRCGQSLLTFVHLAALCRLERRSADKVPFCCSCAYVCFWRLYDVTLSRFRRSHI